ncbi:MAG: RsmG family class I SAM-dependent methyltransferase [Acidimicrobiales bacterium]
MAASWLEETLGGSRARGFLGPGPLEPQILHAKGFAAVWEADHDAPPSSYLDLGTGGGLPGLVLAERWACEVVLLDSMAKRVAYLEESLGKPGAAPGVEVVLGRAEVVARNDDFAGRFELVTARSFGSPAVTAECAARFLRLHGWLVVSEPPTSEGDSRWPEAGLERLGLALGPRVSSGATYQVVRKVAATPDEFPRGVGRPSKRPLF